MIERRKKSVVITSSVLMVLLFEIFLSFCIIILSTYPENEVAHSKDLCLLIDCVITEVPVT